MSIAASHLKYWSKEPPSAVGLRVAELLDAWQGLHHLNSSTMKKVDWTNDYWIELKISKFESVGQLSTFDFSSLTSLVFLAHDHCIRVHIDPCSNTQMRLIFHPRHTREGSMTARHPTIETALAQWRERHQSLVIAPLQPAEPAASTPS